MRIVTTQEFIEFIFAQPLEREVNMNEFNSSFECGCLAAQYTKANFPDQWFTCGMVYVRDGENESIIWKLSDNYEWARSFLHFAPNKASRVTYAEVREHLKKQVWAQEFIPENS
jgi:hypothetical protein